MGLPKSMGCSSTFQNIRYSHIWFLQFRLRSLKEVPNWFKMWFIVCIPNIDYLPQSIIDKNFRKENSDYLEKMKLFLWFMIIYELMWILKCDYGFVEDDDGDWEFVPQLERNVFICWWDKSHLDHLKPTSSKARRILPHRHVVAKLPYSTIESSSKFENLKSLIQSNPSYSKKDLKDKALKNS